MPRPLSSCLLALLLSGCGPSLPPAGAPEAWTVGELPGLRLTKPANWPVTVHHAAAGPLVVIAPTARERLVLSRIDAAATWPVEALAQQVSTQVAAKFPQTVSGPPQAGTIAGRAALRCDLTLPAGEVGQRDVIAGGWVLEWVARQELAPALRSAAEGLRASLELP
ncbi:MAG: hypothetical protein IT204_11290 [Fimbriimonadaceae bacterium]|nr:hypothetical protein [Fimbriimonadaceae bacterium]